MATTQAALVVKLIGIMFHGDPVSDVDGINSGMKLEAELKNLEITRRKKSPLRDHASHTDLHPQKASQQRQNQTNQLSEGFHQRWKHSHIWSSPRSPIRRRRNGENREDQSMCTSSWNYRKPAQPAHLRSSWTESNQPRALQAPRLYHEDFTSLVLPSTLYPP